MIYLTRTTIEPDGTRTTDIAALEDSAWLKRYESQGFVAVPYEVYREAWQAKSMRQRGGSSVPIVNPNTIASTCCPALAYRQRDGSYQCAMCKGQVRAL